MVTMVSLAEGQRVHIIAGAYKKNEYGTYLGPYGKVMSKVKVDGDNRPERHLWRTSIQPILEEKHTGNIPPVRSQEEKKASATATDELISISKAELQTMVDEVSTLKATVAQLEAKLQAVLNIN